MLINKYLILFLSILIGFIPLVNAVTDTINDGERKYPYNIGGVSYSVEFLYGSSGGPDTCGFWINIGDVDSYEVPDTQRDRVKPNGGAIAQGETYDLINLPLTFHLNTCDNPATFTLTAKQGEVACYNNEDCPDEGIEEQSFCNGDYAFTRRIANKCLNPGALNSYCNLSVIYESSQKCYFGCEQGNCIQCTSHDHKKCEGNNLYWYNSCNQEEEEIVSCTTSQTCTLTGCVNKKTNSSREPICGDGYCDPSYESLNSCYKDCASVNERCNNINLKILNFCYYIKDDKIIFETEIKNEGSFSPSLLLSQVRPNVYFWWSEDYLNLMAIESPETMEEVLQAGSLKDLEDVNNQFLESLTKEDLLNFPQLLLYYQNFQNGKIINFKGVVFHEGDGLLEYEDFTNTVKLSSLSITPTLMPLNYLESDDFIPCSEKVIKLEKVTNCKTNEVIWSHIDSKEGMNFQEEITPLQEENNISSNKTLITLPKLPLNKKTYYWIGGIILVILASIFLPKIIKKIKKEKAENKEKPKETKSEIYKNISSAISIKGFTVQYRRNTILNNVDLNIKKGELTCLLGPAGTGKSTIIEAIVGRKKPTKGNIEIFGKSIKDKSIYEHVGFVPQSPEVYNNQTVEQNILSSAVKWGIKNPKNKVDDILSVVGLIRRKDLKASKLSGGQTKLLSLAMELIREPELLILDEPTTGLDPNTRNNVITILSRLVTKYNKTVLLTTHFMDDAEECDEVIIISEGNISAQNSPSKLEKRLPGGGKIVNIVLDNVTDELLKKIKKIDGVEKVISEGRNIRIITDEPNAIRLGQKINEIGGIINRTEIINATMKEVFVYYAGER